MFKQQKMMKNNEVVLKYYYSHNNPGKNFYWFLVLDSVIINLPSRVGEGTLLFNLKV